MTRHTSGNRSSRVGLGVAGAAVAVALAISPCAAQTQPANSVTYGVYDPEGAFADADTLGIEHIYIPWVNADLSSLRQADSYARARQRDLMITVEPWSWVPGSNPVSSKVLANTLNGSYDTAIAATCRAIGGLKGSVIVRWGHEMDLDNDRYLWSNWSPAGYIDAYRHFVRICRQHASNIRYMWSPRGEPGLGRYYPGDDYVDLIGLSIFDLQQHDTDTLGRSRSLAESLKPAYDRVAGYGKPIVIAELGFKGDAAFIEQWLKDTRAIGPQFPALTAVVYFNEAEPHSWPSPYGRPDWRLAPGQSFAK